MSAKKETFIGTVGIVVAVCLACSIVVSGAAVGLKEKQQRNATLDKQSNILEAAGLLADGTGSVTDIYGEFVEQKFVDLATGDFVEMDAGYDMYKAARETDLSSEVDGSAGFGRRADVASIYLIRGENGDVGRYILPVHGSGLWGIMKGFLAVDNDGVTSRALVYYEHMETPGLGAEVLNPKWKAQWDGKKLFRDGEIAIQVKKNVAQGDMYGVDALSGATLTSNGVQNTLDFWLGAQGFGPFLKTINSGA